MAPLYLIEILRLCGFECTGKQVWVTRNADRRISVEQLLLNDEFEVYQSYQSSRQFSIGNYIVSCLGVSSYNARLLGIYRVLSEEENAEIPPQGISPEHQAIFAGPHFRYELQKLEGAEYPRLEQLYGRLVFSFGKGVANFKHGIREDMAVVELLPDGYGKPYPGPMKMNLTFAMLKKVIEHPEAFREWHSKLSSIKAVYHVWDQLAKKVYVGSAYQNEGLLGRWKEYARTGHGNNDGLIEIVGSELSRAKQFRFSVLQVLPSTATQDEVCQVESEWKDKLCSRDPQVGYNRN